MKMIKIRKSVNGIGKGKKGKEKKKVMMKRKK
jgi:hypothetical protein